MPDIEELNAPLSAEQLLKDIVGGKVLAPKWPRQLVNPNAWLSVGRAQAAQRKEAFKANKALIDQFVARQAVADKVERIAALYTEQQAEEATEAQSSGGASRCRPFACLQQRFGHGGSGSFRVRPLA